MAFDPQAWKDEDGMYYIAVATDACNGTTRKRPCVDGQSMYLWRASQLMAPSTVSRRVREEHRFFGDRNAKP